MKKLITIVAALGLMATLVTPAFATPLAPGEISGGATHDVTATTDQEDVYSAVIDWGNMAFNYDFGTWNPSTHAWDGAIWVVADNFDGINDNINITNDSSQPIDASFVYTKDSAKGGETTGSFTKATGNTNTDLTDTMALDLSPVGGPGPDEDTYLNLQNRPAANTTAGKIGTVTVSLVTSAYSFTTELAKILDSTVAAVTATANTETPVETAMIAAAQGIVHSGYTVTMANGAYTPIDATTGTWVGKFTVTNNNTPSNVKTDAANRTISVVVNVVP